MSSTAPLVRVAVAAGIAFGLVQVATTLFTAAFIFTVHPPAQPTLEIPLEAIAAGFAEHAALFAAGNYLYVLQLPFLIAFIAGLAAMLARTEGHGGVLASVTLVSGVAFATMVTMGAVIAGLASRIALLGGDPATVSVIDGVVPLTLALAGFPRAVLLGALVVAARRYGTMGRAMTIITAVLAVLSLASTTMLVSDALFPLTALASLGFAAWAIAAATVLLRRETALPAPASAVVVGA